ncbi:hypothetical protein C943_03316 [Mariniradius saccharolyticus AK6]|uniref:Phage tail tape measure protein domain-containing protein n=1 Tax=Mariniradius saccharolyticus AK6 TaxID=1239962 RepID=M7XIG7_9BACT|nr:phage tail tape measure protein [Mariniradius saccharolyticus]EMS34629.1 hypothetical protein C943_03316 [Mariniradius saccharolyticus AK6]
MGKKLREEDLILNIIVNGDRGKKEMGELERAIKDTNNELRSLEKQQKQMLLAGKKETEEYKAVTQAIKQKNEALVMAESRLKHLRSQVDISKMSLSDLRREMTRVKGLRDIAAPLSEEWRKHDERLTAVTTRYRALSGQAQATGASIQNLASKFNHYIGVITAGFATAFAAISGVRKAISDFAEFDDKVADVMKTTGLYREQVIELNNEFKKIDTRTAQNDLLGLARVAGKLGIEGQEDILGFVRASDQIGVALSEDLGGNVEDAITAVGKLVDIFKLSEDLPLEQALLKVGSTINELGASSTANEAYIVEFTRRMAGVGPLAKMTITDLMGMAATLDSLGQTSEVSTTALSKLFLEMAKNTDVFAKYANMDVESFRRLLDSDANEAFLKVLEGVGNSSEGLTSLADTLGDLGQDGGRVIGVLGSLANNVEKLREQQKLANTAFQEGTSLAVEFGTKNESAQAKLEKARKGLQNMTVELGEKLMPVMEHSISGFSLFVRILSVLLDFFSRNWKGITVLTGALLAYNAALFISNINLKENIVLSKAKVFWDNASLMATQLLAAAQMLLAGNLKGAAQAMRVFNSVAMANPWGLIAAAAVAAGIAIYHYTRNLTAAQKAQKALADVQGEALRNVIDERLEVERLLAFARDVNNSYEDRQAAIKKLNEISPEYLGNLNMENIRTEDATKATDAYIEALLRKAKMEAAYNKVAEIERKRLDLIMEGKGSELTWTQWLETSFFKAIGAHDKALAAFAISRDKNSKALNEDLDAQRAALEQFIKDNQLIEQQVKGTSGSGTPDAAGTPSGLTTIEDLKNQLKALQDEREKIDIRNKAKLLENEKAQIEIQKRLAELDIKSHSDKNNRAKTQADKDEEAREKELERQKEFRQKVLESNLSLINQEKLAYQKRLQEAGIFGKERAQMTEEELQVLAILQKQHYANLDKLDADAISKAIQDDQKAFDDRLRDLRIRQNEEFKSIKTFEQAKAVLQGELSDEALLGLRDMRDAQRELDKKYRREEEAMVRDHLMALQAQLEAAIQSGSFAGVNLADEVLSEEERAVLEERLASIKQLLSELGLGTGTEIAEDRGLRTSNVDLLGFAKSDWDVFFDNLENGRLGIEEMVFAAQALSQMWSQYNALVAAGERRKLQEAERTSRLQQSQLKSQLDANLITQDMYNQQVDKLNADLDRKRAVYERNQAKRERNVALMSAIVNTAAAVAKALPNLILAKIVGIAGGLQIGTILSTPLPDIPGAEDGGQLANVVRSQDGRMFRAKVNPTRRGYVDRPTVIVGEDGSEFVANNRAVRNPTIRPVLDAIDTAQRNGSIDTLNLFKVLEQNRMLRAAMPGRQRGGRLSRNATPAAATAPTSGNTPDDLRGLLQQNLRVMALLTEQLSQPISAEVVLTGRRGLNERQRELSDIEKSASL